MPMMLRQLRKPGVSLQSIPSSFGAALGSSRDLRSRRPNWNRTFSRCFPARDQGEYCCLLCEHDFEVFKTKAHGAVVKPRKPK